MFVKASEVRQQTDLCYCILQHRAEWKTNIAWLPSIQSQPQNKKQRWGKNGSVSNPLYFIYFLLVFLLSFRFVFFTVQVVLAGFSKLYVKLTVNKPDYGYWLLQSVSPLVEKTKTNKKKKQQTTLCSVSCWRCADSESDWINLWLLC